MSRALITAISGLTSNQTAMDIIGNNIANSSTIGFKASRADFADSIYQADSAASNSSPINPQVGLGRAIAATPGQLSQGSFLSTGSATDLSINGSGISSCGGFFVISPSASSAESIFTRAGAFTLNSSGYLVTQDGYYLKGSPTPLTSQTTPSGLETIQIPDTLATGEKVSTFTVASDGAVTALATSGATQTVGYIGVATFINPQGLITVANSRYAYSEAAGDSSSVGTPGTGIAGSIKQGALEVSNVDLSYQFTKMIDTQRSFEANSRTIITQNAMLQTATNLKP